MEPIDDGFEVVTPRPARGRGLGLIAGAALVSTACVPAPSGPKRTEVTLASLAVKKVELVLGTKQACPGDSIRVAVLLEAGGRTYVAIDPKAKLESFPPPLRQRIQAAMGKEGTFVPLGELGLEVSGPAAMSTLNLGYLDVAADPERAIAGRPTVRARATGSAGEVTGEATVPLTFACNYHVDASGQRGMDGRNGQTGERGYDSNTPGGPGGDGEPGGDGGAAPDVRVDVAPLVIDGQTWVQVVAATAGRSWRLLVAPGGSVRVDAQGGAGGRGGAGGTGGVGFDQPAEWEFASNGGDGGHGAAGGNGGPGGRVVLNVDPALASTVGSIVTVDVDGGSGGSGGRPGAGGRSGSFMKSEGQREAIGGMQGEGGPGGERGGPGSKSVQPRRQAALFAVTEREVRAFLAGAVAQGPAVAATTPGGAAAGPGAATSSVAAGGPRPGGSTSVTASPRPVAGGPAPRPTAPAPVDPGAAARALATGRLVATALDIVDARGQVVARLGADGSITLGGKAQARIDGGVVLRGDTVAMALARDGTLYLEGRDAPQRFAAITASGRATLTAGGAVIVGADGSITVERNGRSMRLGARFRVPPPARARVTATVLTLYALPRLR